MRLTFVIKFLAFYVFNIEGTRSFFFCLDINTHYDAVVVMTVLSDRLLINVELIRIIYYIYINKHSSVHIFTEYIDVYEMERIKSLSLSFHICICTRCFYISRNVPSERFEHWIIEDNCGSESFA